VIDDIQCLPCETFLRELTPDELALEEKTNPLF
jgi:hypothetical protein